MKIKRKTDTSSMCIKLTSEEVNAIYEKQQQKLYMQDAKNHCINYFDEHNIRLRFPLNKKNYAILANTFANSHDCNVADNDQWDTIVATYISDLPKVDIPFAIKDYFSNCTASVQDINTIKQLEKLLGSPITNDILKSKEDYIDKALSKMSEEQQMILFDTYYPHHRNI